MYPHINCLLTQAVHFQFATMISLILIATMSASVASDSTVVVHTALGGLKGVTLKSRLNEEFFAFRGIRYGKAPVGELRFKNPLPEEAWKPNVFDATEEGPRCPQGPADSPENSEDCLRLNVYSKDLSVNASKPVIVYLHPGGFYASSGQSKNAGPQLLMDRDIVLVSINYRLGTLGYLATGTADAPGNAGFKDQVLALRWVRDHISNFGGDPNSVTLLGYSAGSMSIGLHMVSPMSKGLFHRGIAMSASPVLNDKYREDQLDLAKKQAELLKCPAEDITGIVNFLKETPFEEFIETLHGMFTVGYHPMLIWQPVIEKDFGQERFLVEDPVTALREGRFEKTPLIVGMTKDEFARIAYYNLKDEKLMKQLNEDWDRVLPIILQYEQNTPKSKELTSILRKEYLNNEPQNSTTPFEPFGNLYSDGIIGFPVHRFAHIAAKHVPVHYYCFAYKGRFSDFKYPGDTAYGSVHHDDLLYLFHVPRLAPLYQKTDPEIPTVERLTRMWTNFAKTGNPNNSKDEYLKEFNWKPLDLSKENYLNIADQLEMKEGLFLDRFTHWEKVLPVQ